jgi:membrane-bound lytic murein transglycosylase F
MRLRWVLSIVALGLSLQACGESERAGLLEQVQRRGTLVVLTRNAPTTYYEGRDGWQGLEYDLASAFADHLGVEIRFRVLGTIAAILDALERGEADLAAAGLTRTGARTQSFLAGPAYQKVEQQVVCRRNGRRPKGVAQLSEVDLIVPAESSYLERLETLKQTHSGLTWRISPHLGTEQLLQQVWEREIDCTVADSNIVAINRRYHPELSVMFDLGEPEPLVWLLPQTAGAFQEEIERWFDSLEQSGQLERHLHKYYGFIDIFDYVDVRRFRRRIDETLPQYRPLFEEAAKSNGLDWTLLAGQAYQESHWNPRAQSPTGVRGMMMLTLPTARELGVDDRLDPAQSIAAGARYLAGLRRRLPEEIEEPDRTWIALAAYNVGMGHVYDARTLARRLDKDPDEWRQLAEVLPLLAQRRFFRTLKHGYARGSEPVRYVSRIRDYQDMLRPAVGGSYSGDWMDRSSTSKTSVLFGPIRGPAPRSP